MSLTRTSKTLKTKEFKSFKIEMGVIDKRNPKSIYCDLKFHIESSDTNYRANIRKFLKSIENDVELNIDSVLFHEKFIMCADSPETIKTIGRGYITLSFNFFIKNMVDFQKEHYCQKVITLIEQIEKKHFFNCELFEISKQKKLHKNKIADL